MTRQETQPGAAPAPSDESIGRLVSQISEQTSRLVRDEMKLAQLELGRKGKEVGIGAGLFGGAGVFALYGTGALVAAAIAGLATTFSVWASALIVGAALFVLAGIAALVGKREVAAGTPPLPEEAIAGLKQDAQALKPGSRS